jgi:hypothetical protein
MRRTSSDLPQHGRRTLAGVTAGATRVVADRPRQLLFVIALTEVIAGRRFPDLLAGNKARPQPFLSRRAKSLFVRIEQSARRMKSVCKFGSGEFRSGLLLHYHGDFATMPAGRGRSMAEDASWNSELRAPENTSTADCKTTAPSVGR